MKSELKKHRISEPATFPFELDCAPVSGQSVGRSIRPFTVGRRNWLFNNTPKGATASAMLYSIIEIAKESGLKPYEYLKYIFEVAPNPPRVDDPETIAVLLPWNAPPACHDPA